MKLSKTLFLLALLCLLPEQTLYAKDLPLGNQTLDQAYLSHWFSYDSLEEINLKLAPLSPDDLGKRSQITFTSDDGQLVNGLIAYPQSASDSKKLAFALHPMGIDQRFWWSDKSPLDAQKITASLRFQGYIVISLDARLHGERGRQDFGPQELLKRAHSAEPRVYIDTIIGTVRDYRIILNWAKREFEPNQVLALGYSMGAQMSLLLASYEPSVDAVLAMVPPFVGSPTSPVAPRIHVQRLSDAKVLWLAGSNDPHSSNEQTQETFSRIKSKDKKLAWFDSGHRLPPQFIDTALSFLSSINADLKKQGDK